MTAVARTHFFISPMLVDHPPHFRWMTSNSVRRTHHFGQLQIFCRPLKLSSRANLLGSVVFAQVFLGSLPVFQPSSTAPATPGGRAHPRAVHLEGSALLGAPDDSISFYSLNMGWIWVITSILKKTKKLKLDGWIYKLNSIKKKGSEWWFKNYSSTDKKF